MDYATVLASWQNLVTALKTATEKQCLALYDWERAGQNRATIKLRIHARYNRLRGQREREEWASS